MPSSSLLPNFVILGSAKCGTTTLYEHIGQHPEVFFSVPKEPIFFEAEYEKGLDYYRDTYFAGWNGEAAVGEARHRNPYLPYVAPRIRECCPDAKLIVIVRNPVDRAYSDWLMRRGSGVERLDFEAAIESDLRRIESGQTFEGRAGEDSWRAHLLPLLAAKQEPLSRAARNREYSLRTYVDSGFYASQIRRYLELFPREQLQIVFLEDLASDPQATCSMLWRHLGLRDHFLSSTVPVGVGGKFVAARAYRIVDAIAGQRLRSWIPGAIRSRAHRMLNVLAPSNPTMNSATRTQLAEIYAKHNRALEELTGRDLSHWSEPSRAAPRVS